MKALRDWLARRRRRGAACVLDGELPVCVRRRPVEWLAERLQAGRRGAVLLLDHAHAGAAEMLRTLQLRHAEHFAAGSVVVGVENLPGDGDAALESYRRMAWVPVFGVDLRRPSDMLLLDEALVAARVAATLRAR